MTTTETKDDHNLLHNYSNTPGFIQMPTQGYEPTVEQFEQASDRQASTDR